MDELISRVAALLARLGATGLGQRVGRAVDRTTRLTRPVRRGWGITRPVRRWLGARVGPTVRWALRTARPGRPPILYRDAMITLDREGVVISSYYLPFGRRRIPYADIRGVESFALTGARAYRVHGYGWPRLWYHRDSRRGERTQGLLLDTGGVFTPVLTPIDVTSVRELLAERMPDESPGQPTVRG